MTVSRARGAKARADKYFSLIVRSRGACQNCGSTQNLQTMHIISRRYNNTRTSLRNALCGCAKCHRRFTDFPVEFADFVLATIGDVEYALLVHESMQPLKMDWEAEAARLRDLWNQIEAAA